METTDSKAKRIIRSTLSVFLLCCGIAIELCPALLPIGKDARHQLPKRFIVIGNQQMA